MDFSKLLSWIPGWLGFLGLIIVGALMAVHGLANPLGVALDHANRVGFSVFGICAFLVGLISWIVGGTSKIKGKEGTVGIKVSVSDMPWYGWVIDIGLVVVAIILYVIIA